jgi:hypothetical protein
MLYCGQLNVYERLSLLYKFDEDSFNVVNNLFSCVGLRLIPVFVGASRFSARIPGSRPDSCRDAQCPMFGPDVPFRFSAEGQAPSQTPPLPAPPPRPPAATRRRVSDFSFLKGYNPSRKPHVKSVTNRFKLSDKDDEFHQEFQHKQPETACEIFFKNRRNAI